MIQNELEHLEGAVAKATRKRDARFVVHSFHRGVEVFGEPEGRKPVGILLAGAKHFGISGRNST